MHLIGACDRFTPAMEFVFYQHQQIPVYCGNFLSAVLPLTEKYRLMNKQSAQPGGLYQADFEDGWRFWFDR